MRRASRGTRSLVVVSGALSVLLIGSVWLLGAPPLPLPDVNPSRAPAASAAPARSEAPLRSLPPVPVEKASSPKTPSQDMQWIWTPAYVSNLGQKSPAGACYFRRTFEMTQPEAGEVQIAADHSYQLYVNGRKVGEGKNWHVMGSHDITKYLVSGHNTVAVLATKDELGPAGMAAKILVKNAGDTYVSYVSNSTWKTAQKEFVGWTNSRFNEVQWLSAREVGQFGIVKPWLDESQLAGAGGNGRFKIGPEFNVEQVASPQDTGSLIAMAFNEFGELLAARENGPLLLLRNLTPGDSARSVSVYCDQVKNIQGILPLNGQVFVVGAGPSGVGMYRISEFDDAAKSDSPKSDGAKDDKKSDDKKSDDKKYDDDADPKPIKPPHKANEKKVELVLKFTGEMSEHGPHAPILGPDGLIYIMLGDHSNRKRTTIRAALIIIRMKAT